MIVSELIELLKQVPSNAVVVLSRDEEGNGFLPLRVVEDGMRYDFDSCEVGYAVITPSMKLKGYTDEDALEIHDGVNCVEECVILWP